MKDLLNAYNFARRGGLTPFEYVCKIWTSEPDRFNVNPYHQMAGPNNPKTPHYDGETESQSFIIVKTELW